MRMSVAMVVPVRVIVGMVVGMTLVCVVMRMGVHGQYFTSFGITAQPWTFAGCWMVDNMRP